MYCGYAFLVETLRLSAFFPECPSRVSRAVNRKVETAACRLIPPRMAPKTSSIVEHALFALKHEGVNLQILAEAVPLIPEEDLRRQLEARSSGVFVRKLGFLWERFTGRTLVGISVSGSYADFFDEDRYFTGPRRPDAKWRINFNGIGGIEYCPMVRRTPKLSEERLAGIFDRARAFFGSLSAGVFDRASEWACLYEMKSTFEIERETPSASQTERTVALLKGAKAISELTQQTLCDIRNALTADTDEQASSYRTKQNYLAHAGRSNAFDVTYVPPPPEDLPSVMKAYLAMLSAAPSAVNPVIAAAAASFGFVYLHPFTDGNGRVSRFLIHRTLADAGVLPEGTILPVSAAIAEDEKAYLEALEKFAKPCRERWCISRSEAQEMTFIGKVSLYRFWDATAQTEFTADMCEKALDAWMKEVDWLREYDRIRREVNRLYDVRDYFLAQLISAALEEGRLSGPIRRRFENKIDPTIFDFIESRLPSDLGRL